MIPLEFAPVPVLRRELVRELQLEGLRFTESWHEPGSVIGRHAHRRATLTILVDGSFEERYTNGRAMTCVAPAVHVRPPGEPHLDRLGAAGAHNLVLEVDSGRLAGLRPASALFDEVRQLDSPRVVRVARAIERELSCRDDAATLVLEGLALELMGESARESEGAGRHVPGWLVRVRERLDDVFLESGLRLGELAEAEAVHPVHLARAFRRHFGSSPGEYARRRRVEWAARAVVDGAGSLAEIAQLAGFADQSHMTRTFRRELGTTPGELRRRAGRDRDAE